MAATDLFSAIYQDADYSDADRAAAAALRLPLLAQLLTVPASERAAWLASLTEGLRDGIVQDPSLGRDADAYATGQRMALLLTEEGHV